MILPAWIRIQATKMQENDCFMNLTRTFFEQNKGEENELKNWLELGYHSCSPDNWYVLENGASLLAVNGDGNMPYDICEDETTLSYIENEMAKRGVTQDLIDTTRAETENQMLADLVKLSENGEDLEFR